MRMRQSSLAPYPFSFKAESGRNLTSLEELGDILKN